MPLTVQFSRPTFVPVVCALLAMLVALYIVAYRNFHDLAESVALGVRRLLFPLLVIAPVLRIRMRSLPWGPARDQLRAVAAFFIFAPLVEGTIQYAGRHSRGAHGESSPYIRVNGQRYELTLDMFRKLRAGDHIRAEAGAGSNTLLGVQR